MQLRQLCLAEFIGTFALVFVGTAAIVADSVLTPAGASVGPLGNMGIAACFGLIVAVMIYSIGEVSGAHMNPAVTLAFAVAKRFPWRQVTPYVLSQCCGAVLASLCVLVLIGDNGNMGGTRPGPYETTLPPWLRTGLLEVLFSWLLMFVILGVSTGAKEKGLMAGVAIGGTVALLAAFGGPLTNASMNPARSLGPDVVSGQLAYLPLYIIAPCLGTCLAVWTMCILRPQICCTNEQSPDGCDPSSGCC